MGKRQIEDHIHSCGGLYPYNWFNKNYHINYRLKRVVKGKHWVLEDYYGINDDFNEVVERQYRHFK